MPTNLLPLSPDVNLDFVSSEPVLWVRVLDGEGDGTPTDDGRTLYARSQCSFYCPTAQVAAKCIAALKESDDRLRARAEDMMLWEWFATYWEADPANSEGGGTVHLGVGWYDEAFYRQRKGAGFERMHEVIYSKIGVPRDGIVIQHFILDTEAA